MPAFPAAAWRAAPDAQIAERGRYESQHHGKERRGLSLTGTRESRYNLGFTEQVEEACTR